MPGRTLSERDFTEAIQKFAWSRRIWRVDVQGTHGTAGSVGPHAGIACGAPESAHIIVGRDGTIRSGRDWNKASAVVGVSLGTGAFTIEAAGCFDHGRDRLEGEQWDSLIGAIDALQHHFGLPVHALLFHRELPHLETTCPGSSIDKSEMLQALQLRRHRPRAAEAVSGLPLSA